jgi:hypothetical protein
MTMSRRLALIAAAVLCAAVVPAAAEKMANPVAVFTGLDKITGRIITFDVYIDETVQFGALRVTPRVCYTRPQTETQQTDAFIEVDEITLDNQVQRIFSGWMFAASPGLNAVEHPVFDVWLNDCRETSDVPPPGQRDGDTREAQALESADESDGATGVQMIDGVPIPRPKPPAPVAPVIEETVDPDAIPEGEILD